jgi:hypothetical protein
MMFGETGGAGGGGAAAVSGGAGTGGGGTVVTYDGAGDSDLPDDPICSPIVVDTTTGFGSSIRGMISISSVSSFEPAFASVLPLCKVVVVVTGGTGMVGPGTGLVVTAGSGTAGTVFGGVAGPGKKGPVAGGVAGGGVGVGAGAGDCTGVGVSWCWELAFGCSSPALSATVTSGFAESSGGSS